jgi:hypothetical protein
MYVCIYIHIYPNTWEQMYVWIELCAYHNVIHT